MVHFCVHPALGVLRIVASSQTIGSARQRLEIRASKENGDQLIADCPTGPLILVQTPYPPRPDGSWNAEHVDRGGLPGPFRIEVPHLLLDYCSDVLKAQLGVPSRQKPADAYALWLAHRQRAKIVFFAEPPKIERGKVTLEKAKTLSAYIDKLDARANNASQLEDSSATNILLGIIECISLEILGIELHEERTELQLQAFADRQDEIEADAIKDWLSRIWDEERNLTEKSTMEKCTAEQKEERRAAANDLEEIRNFLGDEFGYKPTGMTP